MHTHFALLDPLGQGSRSDELLGDEAWLQALVDVEVALVGAMVDAGLAPQWMTGVASAISHATDLDAGAIAAGGRAGGNPVIPLVKQLGARAEVQHTGASDFIHVGATSQDILDTAAMLIARRCIDEIARQLDDVIANLVRLAELHRGTPLAGRTLGQHASPTSFGLVVAGWLDGIGAARRRIDAVDAALPVQYGGSVGTLGVLADVAAARLPESTPAEFVASVSAALGVRLGLRMPAAPWHTNRVTVVELGAALASLVGAIGAMATDVGVLSRTEIGEVSERLSAGEGGSSAMPHKRNPVTSVLLVSAARQVPGAVSTLFAAQVAEDQRPSGAWHAEWAALRQLERLAIDSATAGASLVSRLEVDVARMRANLDVTDGLIYSERVSTVLAEAIGKTVAFDLVSSASREAVQTGRPLKVVISSQLAGGRYDDGLLAKVWDAFEPESGMGVAAQLVDRIVRENRGAAS